MGYYFDLDDLQREMTDSYLCSQRFESILAFKVNNLKDLCGRLPEENEAFFIETKKSFTAFTFIVYIIKWTGRVNHLYIGTAPTNASSMPCCAGGQKDWWETSTCMCPRRSSSVCPRCLPNWWN